MSVESSKVFFKKHFIRSQLLVAGLVICLVILNVFVISFFSRNGLPEPSDASVFESSYKGFQGSGLSKKDFIIQEAMKLAPSRANVCAEYEFVDGDETKAIKCFYAVYYSMLE